MQCTNRRMYVVRGIKTQAKHIQTYSRSLNANRILVRRSPVKWKKIVSGVQLSDFNNNMDFLWHMDNSMRWRHDRTCSNSDRFDEIYALEHCFFLIFSGKMVLRQKIYIDNPHQHHMGLWGTFDIRLCVVHTKLFCNSRTRPYVMHCKEVNVSHWFVERRRSHHQYRTSLYRHSEWGINNFLLPIFA